MLACENCGIAIARDYPAAKAYRRVVATETDEIPDLRGSEALFHEACAPDWGDPHWVSRSEGPLSDLKPESAGDLVDTAG